MHQLKEKINQMVKVVGFLLLATICCISGVKYDNCEAGTYYADLMASNTLEDKVALHAWIKSSHRDVIPYTSSSKLDSWDALKQLDAGAQPGTIILTYGSQDVPAEPHGTSSTWNREHLWPKSRGVNYDGPDFTDLHHLRPADATVNTSRSNRYFATCGVAEPQYQCIIPAHSEAATDTERDSFTFLPPANQRGDIARALFYMALRYDETTSDTEKLVLTDCPDSVPNSMGYLSQLLQWHMWDPVNDAERERNKKVCSDWQGNRNPYVDFPELVVKHFGSPQSPPDPLIGTGYATCPAQAPNVPAPVPVTAPAPMPLVTTKSPTKSPTKAPVVDLGIPESCRGLKGGDLMISGFNSVGSLDEIVLTPLRDIPGGAMIYITDNAWTGTKFRTNEGTARLLIPSAGIPKGIPIGYGGSATAYQTAYDSLWIGSVQLSTSGDNIHVYCLDSKSSVVHLSAVTYASGGWTTQPVTNEADLTTSMSVLPSTLAASSVLTLPHFDNNWYTGVRSGTQQQLLGYLSDANKWAKSDTSLMDANVGLTPFSVIT